MAMITIEPMQYLEPQGAKTVRVHLNTVSFKTLEQLNQIANFTTEAPGKPILLAHPDIIKAGRAWSSLRDEPLITWLRENAPSFQPTLDTVEKRWGSQIVHENLLIAKVADLGLKVQLEHTFRNTPNILFLSDDHLAFPRSLLSKVEQAVTKAGHVVKRVDANET